MQRSYPAPVLSACVLWALLSTVAAPSLAAHTTPKRQPGSQTLTGPARSVRLTVRGAIQTYDVPTRTLSLMTTTGVVTISLPPTTHVSRGAQTLAAADLTRLAGYRVTVRYSDSNGTKIADTIHVFDQSRQSGRLTRH